MADMLLRMLMGATLGLLLVLLLRRLTRRVFGAGAAFTLWLLPVVLALAPWLPLPQRLAPAAMVVLPGLAVTPHAVGAAAPGATVDWVAWLTTVWLAGAVIGMVQLVMHYAHLRHAACVAPRAWVQALARLTPAPDPRHVRVHPAGPAVLWALPRTLVLLPEDFCTHFGTDAARELVLRHELTHARRGDAWWSLAMEIASALLWFHPLAWLARSRFRLDQELACDAAALRAAPQYTAGYARALLDSAAVQSVPALIPWLAEPQLKVRIAMLARIPPGAPRRRSGYVAVAVVLAGGVYVAGGQTPVSAAVRDVSASAPPMALMLAMTKANEKSAAPVVDATFKNQHMPRYPIEAIRQGEQGQVVLDVTLDASGRVTRVVTDPRGTTAAPVLQDAAIAAARGWRYTPGHKDGKAVGGVVRIPVNFSLEDVTVSTSGAPSVDLSYKNRNPPRYPAGALKKGEQGSVILDVTVTASGAVSGVQVDQRGTNASAALQLAAVEAARQWKFNPGQKDGKPMGGVIQIPVDFSLNDTPADASAAKPCPAGDLFDVATARCVPQAPHFIPPASVK